MTDPEIVLTGQFKGKTAFNPDGVLQSSIQTIHVDGLKYQTKEEPKGVTTDFLLDDRGNLAYVKQHGRQSTKFIRDYSRSHRQVLINGYVSFKRS